MLIKIYSGEAIAKKGSIIVNTMVDNNNDIVFFRKNGIYFARLAIFQFTENKETKPCIVLFEKEKDPFFPMHVCILEEGVYVNELGTYTSDFQKELEKFWKEVENSLVF